MIFKVTTQVVTWEPRSAEAQRQVICPSKNYKPPKFFTRTLTFCLRIWGPWQVGPTYLFAWGAVLDLLYSVAPRASVNPCEPVIIKAPFHRWVSVIMEPVFLLARVSHGKVLGLVRFGFKFSFWPKVDVWDHNSWGAVVPSIEWGKYLGTIVRGSQNLETRSPFQNENK